MYVCVNEPQPSRASERVKVQVTNQPRKVTMYASHRAAAGMQRNENENENESKIVSYDLILYLITTVARSDEPSGVVDKC